MVNVKYNVVEEMYTTENKTRVSYGIIAYHNNDDKKIISTIHDITSDRVLIDELVKHCNELLLSPIHLEDVIIDMLS